MIVNQLIVGTSLVIISTIIGSVGALMFKLSSKELEKGFLMILKNMKLYFGIILYGISALFFVYALKFGELSVLYPIGALNYVWISLLSIKFLNEKINRYKWLGILLIMIGVIFIGFGA